MFDRKAWAAAYYAKNKAHLREKQKEYEAANKAAIAERKRAYRAANKPSIDGQKKAWQQANKDRVAQYNRKWKQANRDLHNALGMKRHAAKMNRTPPWLTAHHFNQMKEKYDMARQLTAETGRPHEVDHIVPLQGETVSGLHVPWNLRVVERTENRSKFNHLSCLPAAELWGENVHFEMEQ
jgi:5-methylcytosine-specific restriction endonuclease McrA